MNGITKIGQLIPKSSKNIKSSRIGIGLEKLDRDLYNPNPVYDPISETGAKWVRLQSGWCKTEKEKGVYDFAWLDDIVNNLTKRGMIPWICLCYGNELYTKEANNKTGAIGFPPTHTQEERDAWEKYVTACVNHFKDRVDFYEVWNEPDGGWCWRYKDEDAATEYGKFVKRTADHIKKAYPDAKVLAGSFCMERKFLYHFMKETDPKNIDYITFHQYKCDIDTAVEEFAISVQEIIKLFSDKIGIIQGETGTQSAFSTNGALAQGNWNEDNQAKYILRKLMIDFKTDVLFTSIFTSVDIFENIFNDEGTMHRKWYGFFGLLGEAFDEEGKPLGKYYKKPSFYAYQNVCSIFTDEVEKTNLPLCWESLESGALYWRKEENPEDRQSLIVTQGYSRKNGAKAMVYWKATDVITTCYESTVSFSSFGLGNDIKLVDLYTGEVLAIDKSKIEENNGQVKVKNIPIKDYPMIITFGDFCDYSEEK